MKFSAFFLISIISTTFLSSCASLPQECDAGRFSDLGYANAKAGRPPTLQTIDQCGQTAGEQYREGYQRGLTEFCSVERIRETAQSHGSRGFAAEAVDAEYFQACDGKEQLYSAYQESYTQGFSNFCSLDRVKGLGALLGQKGNNPDFSLVQYQRCGDKVARDLQTSYWVGYHQGLKQFCSPANFAEEGYLHGLRGDRVQAIEAKIERCPAESKTHLLGAYDTGMRSGLKLFCQTGSLRQVAIKEAQRSSDGKLPEALRICEGEYPNIESKFLSLYRKERARFVKDHCQMEAGFSEGAQDAKSLTEHRSKTMPAFCDDENFPKFQEGYLDGWKAEKDKLCSVANAYDLGIKDAQSSKQMRIQVPETCPPDYTASMIRKYREGYLYYKNRVAGELPPGAE